MIGTLCRAQVCAAVHLWLTRSSCHSSLLGATQRSSVPYADVWLPMSFTAIRFTALSQWSPLAVLFLSCSGADAASPPCPSALCPAGAALVVFIARCSRAPLLTTGAAWAHEQARRELRAWRRQTRTLLRSPTRRLTVHVQLSQLPLSASQLAHLRRPRIPARFSPCRGQRTHPRRPRRHSPLQSGHLDGTCWVSMVQAPVRCRMCLRLCPRRLLSSGSLARVPLAAAMRPTPLWAQGKGCSTRARSRCRLLAQGSSARCTRATSP